MTKKVLLVEDYRDIREMMAALLWGAGFEVAKAADGNEAIEKAFENPPDVILTDLYMPNCDGLEMTRKLRQMPQFAATPIIMLSADRSRKIESLKAGADLFFKKPMDMDTLIGIIEQLTTSASVPAALVAMH